MPERPDNSLISARTIRQLDWVLLGAAFLLCVLGVLFVWSASFRLSEQTGDWRATSQPLRQIIWLGISAVVFVAIVAVPYTVFMRLSYACYIVGMGLLVGLLFMPTSSAIQHVFRWYRIGPFLFQPSEYMKVVLVMTLARYLMYRENYRTLPGLIGPFIVALVPMILILKEPDLGTALVFLPILFALLYTAGARRKHLIAIILIGVVSLPVLYYAPHVLEDYQRDRIIAFINPAGHAKDLQSGSYQVINSVIAVGSGGLAGKGWGKGTQNLFGFIPADQTDFIFAVYAEEWGFLGAGLLLFLYFLIFTCGLSIAKSTREPYGRLVAVGVVVMWAVQVFVNIGMTVQLMPVTGIPLPFMSYGGSSLLSSFIALGLLVNVGKNRIPVLADEDFK